VKHLHYIAVTVLLVGACASTSGSWETREPRPADDTPTAFVTEDGTTPVEACRSPLIDPRDQTRLRLIRSAPMGGSHRGDYEVTGGRYGVGENELLRIDCTTGEPLGIVRN